jgi:hypothetical protein
MTNIKKIEEQKDFLQKAAEDARDELVAEFDLSKARATSILKKSLIIGAGLVAAIIVTTLIVGGDEEES